MMAQQTSKMSFVCLVLFCVLSVVLSCSDWMMNFNYHRLSGRTMDLGTLANWTMTVWPRDLPAMDADPFSRLYDEKDWNNEKAILQGGWKAEYGSVGISGNWFGDDKFGFPTFFADSLNEKGVSCAFLMLLETKYEPRGSGRKEIFAPVFCHWVAQTKGSVAELLDEIDDIAIVGPDILSQHFIVRDASGTSVTIEVMNGKKNVYVDKNDGVDTFGITTNEPELSWHLENVKHYEWKRTLSRQSIAVPGNWYPEERYLRAYMIKSGMEEFENTTNWQEAFALTSQVMNSVSVPMGNQYGTDSGAGEGEGDHTTWSIVRDHKNPAIYWRDAYNPTFRRVSLDDLNFRVGSKRRHIKMEDGPSFIDLTYEF